MTSTKSSCSVCFEEVTEQSSAVCNSCGQVYHLNQRADLPGKDCGQVWISEEHMALEFACNTCLDPPASATALEEIVDIDEAASLLGVASAALASAAAAGNVRHRKTGGGVYLFAKADLLAYRNGGNG